MKYALAGNRVVTHGDEFWIAPNAAVIGKVRLARNASIWWSAVLRGDTEPITLGENANVQDGAVLHTDIGFPLILGKNVTVGHMVMLHGCEIGDNTLIGIGSVILNGAKIGRNCVIGANSFIREGKSIPDDSLVFGSPAKVARKIAPKHSALILEAAEFYVANWKRYKAELTPDD